MEDSRMRKTLGLLAALAATSLLLALSAGQALASTVHCGDVITQDTTLTSDLSGCSGAAALGVIGDVTLDLNGHTISGDAATGILAGRADVQLTIRDGTVSGFGTGVLIAKGGGIAYVTRVTASYNGFGFDMGHSRALFDRDVATFNTYDGFLAQATPGTAVVATFLRNRADSNGALGIRAPNATDLGKNHAHKNGDPRQCVGVVCRP
jgi:hypothetical protein